MYVRSAVGDAHPAVTGRLSVKKTGFDRLGRAKVTLIVPIDAVLPAWQLS